MLGKIIKLGQKSWIHSFIQKFALTRHCHRTKATYNFKRRHHKKQYGRSAFKERSLIRGGDTVKIVKPPTVSDAATQLTCSSLLHAGHTKLTPLVVETTYTVDWRMPNFQAEFPITVLFLIECLDVTTGFTLEVSH